MTRHKLVLLIMGLFIFHTSFFGQGTYSFTHINGDNGLSASNVKVILQDSYGFMWFGTKNGLNRYDGISIRKFDCDDLVAGKGNHNIGALYEDNERNLWVGTDRGIYIYDPASDIFSFVDKRSSEGIAPGNWVQEIVGDPQGNVWVLIPDEGLFRFNGDNMDYYPITDKTKFKKETPSSICVSPRGEIWVGTSGVGLYCYDSKTNRFVQHLKDRTGVTLEDKNIVSISFRGDELIAGMHDGELIRYNPLTNQFGKLSVLPGTQNYLRDLMCFGDEIWVGTQNGLFIINEQKAQVTHLKEDLMRSFSLSDNIIFCIYRDREGGTWLGTMFGGVNYLPSHQISFEKYVPGSDDTPLNSKRIRGLAEDNVGNVWVGTENAGINILSPATGNVRRTLDKNDSLKMILCIKNYHGSIYAGSFNNGVDVFDSPDAAARNICSFSNSPDNNVYAFLNDSKGCEWVGVGWGLFKKEPGENHYSRVEETGFDWIFDLFEDNEGVLWMASMGNGIWKYDPALNTFKNYSYVEERPNGLTSNSISSIMQDSKGQIWFSTDRGGICRYNKKSDDFTSFGVKHGLPDDVTYNILEDNNGNLWFGTNNGLVRFHPENHDIRTFTTKDGLLGNQFNYNSALKASDGRFYFGSIDGLIAFNPDVQNEVLVLPPVYISRFYIYNEEITVHKKNSPLKQCITHTDKITLPYHRDNLSFDVALLSFATTEINEYSYRMDPIDKDWISSSGNKNISYAKLPPGNYTFRVRATHNGAGGKYSVRSLSIEILPPWWKSTWAYISYFLIGALLVVCCFLWYKRRKEREMREHQKLFAIEKEKELYESKVEFFTEIAHEIRTPLTLINGPLEAIEEIGVKDTHVHKYLRVISQNTHRLLELTGQLLDFQKIGANKIILKPEKVNIVILLSEIMDCFESAIMLNEKKLVRNLPGEEFYAAVDKDAITKIVSNLLNNALKYARERIVVELTHNEDLFKIRVISDGEPISEEEAQRIFDPFYQSPAIGGTNKGFGIGLSLARSLAALHKGSLSLENTTGSDTNCFVLNIAYNEEEVEKIVEELHLGNETLCQEEDFSTDTKTGYTVLLAEDNNTMRRFLCEQLQKSFTVETACNGEEALEILRTRQVDLLISDIMMPVMNGYELCRNVKSDLELSHIPIIFLTAKNDLNSKIHGLRYGAEAYVEKPFSFHYLKEQALSLLNNRRREREAFSKRPFFTVDSMQMNKADEEFMNRVICIIEENLTDENFSVARLSEILCMSRSSLLRKIKTLFNLSPLDFIRLIKLKKAAELIQEGKHRIGDICYLVGINSPSYFSKIFLKQFGMTPKDFEKKCQKGIDCSLIAKTEEVSAT